MEEKKIFEVSTHVNPFLNHCGPLWGQPLNFYNYKSPHPKGHANSIWLKLAKYSQTCPTGHLRPAVTRDERPLPTPPKRFAYIMYLKPAVTCMPWSAATKIHSP